MIFKKCCCDCDLTASFSYDCDGWTAHFTDTSTTSGTITDWLWDFGDGDTSTSQNPDHTYTDTGPFTVTLTVTDENCTRSTSGEVSCGSVECPNCSPDDLPDEVFVTITNGTSARGCDGCDTDLAGTYVLEATINPCEWKYTQSAGSCVVCTSPATSRALTLTITAAVITSGSDIVLRVTVGLTYPQTVDDVGCALASGVFTYNLGASPQNCMGDHTLSKISNSGSASVCDYPSSLDLSI